MYRDCIALAVYSNSQATIYIMLPSPSSGQSHNLLNKPTTDTASEPGVRGTSFRIIPQAIKIINLLFLFFVILNLPKYT